MMSMRAAPRVFSPLLLGVSLTLAGLSCVLPDKMIGDGDTATDTGDTATTDMGDTTADTGDTTADTGDTDPCAGPFASLSQDVDCDGLAIACDNARDHHNPDQLDQDRDGFGDVVDICPLVPSASNTADSDFDGVGNDCDVCRRQVDDYNVGMNGDARMWARNNPSQQDSDHDGIGDVCDNCVVLANCGDFGPNNPHGLGDELPWEDPQQCQTDADLDMIGDACAGQTLTAQAVGPVDLGPNDDFDQDGLANLFDACPRQPVDPIPCDSDADCPDGRECPVLQGLAVCNHLDSDNDGVGDVCDTCPTKPNPMQVTDGGMQIDDADGDFVGADCETHVDCALRRDPPPLGFYDVAVGGLCCVALYPGDAALHDPLGRPVTLDCSPVDEEAGLCRRVPDSVVSAPGMVTLPLGCAQALADAGVTEASPLTLADVGGDADALWSRLCRLPQWDQDFDGLGDACDLCPLAFDPDNEAYVDEQNMMWPNAGAACNGDFGPDMVPSVACWP